MITAEVVGEAGAEVEDEAAVGLHPGVATAAREKGVEGGHPRLSMSPGTDTRPLEAPPMTETDTSHVPGPGHRLPETVTDHT